MKDLARNESGDWLPMPYTEGAKRLEGPWVEYRERRRRHLEERPDYDAHWHRPSATTSEAVWELVQRSGTHWPGNISHLRPDHPWLTDRDKHDLEVQAKQALVVALDVVHTSLRFTTNTVFDALAGLWSDHYRRACSTTPARLSWDMRAVTLKASLRDLRLVGLNFAAILRAVKNGVPGLYETTPVPGGGYEIEPEWQLLPDWTAILVRDHEYRSPGQRLRILLGDAESPPSEIDAAVVAEWAYNVAPLGPRGAEVVRKLEGARLLADIYRIGADTAQSNDKNLAAIRGAVAEVEAAGAVKDGLFEIKTAVVRTMNRRYQPRNFWPVEVTGGDPKSEDFDSVRVTASRRARWFRARRTPEAAAEGLVGYDVSGSQIQILSVLLGLEELESMTAAESFKAAAARRAWAKHVDPDDPFELPTQGGLAFSGPDDMCLRNAVRTAAMTHLYGSSAEEVARKLVGVQTKPKKTRRRRALWQDTQRRKMEASKEFGPGLGSGSNVLHLLRDKSLNLAGILEVFLPACQTIAAVACDRDKYAGVLFTDPLDGTPVRWNPPRLVSADDDDMVPAAQQAGAKVPKLASIKLYTRLVRGVPDASGDYPVDRAKLKRLIAPCVTHMLDALFASFVIEQLHARGIKNLVSVHDCWLVPMSASADLEAAIAAAGEPWLRSLGPVYDRLAVYLSDDPTYGPWVAAIRDNWQKRVAAGDRWPKFRVSPAELFATEDLGTPLAQAIQRRLKAAV